MGLCRQVILHTFWGGRVNRPLVIALVEAWERSQGSTLEAFARDLGLRYWKLIDFTQKSTVPAAVPTGIMK